MKTLLAVLGALAIAAVVLVVGGGYLAYKKGTSAMADAGQVQIDRFIETKHPSVQVSDSLRRLTNAVKLHQSLYGTLLVTYASTAVQDGVVTDQEQKMIDDAGQLAEQGQITREQYAAFARTYQAVLTTPHYKKP